VLLREWVQHYRALYRAVGKGETVVEVRKVYRFEDDPAQPGQRRKVIVADEVTEYTPSLSMRKAFGDVLLLYGLGQIKDAPMTQPTAPESGEPTMPPLVFRKLVREPAPVEVPPPVEPPKKAPAKVTSPLTASGLEERVARALMLAREKLDKSARSGNIATSPPQEPASHDAIPDDVDPGDGPAGAGRALD